MQASQIDWKEKRALLNKIIESKEVQINSLITTDRSEEGLELENIWSIALLRFTTG